MEIPDWAMRLLPPVLGAGIAAALLNGPKIQRAAKAVGGIAISYYGTPPLVSTYALTEWRDIIAVLVAMLAMAVVAKLWELISAFRATEFWQPLGEWFRAFLRLPPKER